MHKFPSDWEGLSASDFLSRWYLEHYSSNAYSGTQGLIQSLMHKSIERGRNQHFDEVLELGADVGQHMKFVKHTFKRYYATDFRASSDQNHFSQFGQGVVFRLEDAQNLSFQSEQFDRVLCACVLHHLPDPEMALLEIRRVLKPGGTADLFVSADPGAMFRLARRLGPLRAARKAGLADVKRLVDARDHRGHVLGILRLARFVFRNDQIRVRSYPFPGLKWNFSLWFVIRVRKSLER